MDDSRALAGGPRSLTIAVRRLAPRHASSVVLLAVTVVAIVGLALLAPAADGAARADGAVALLEVVDSPGLPKGASADPDEVRLSLQRVAGGFDQPVHVTDARDGTKRMFVVERAGVIRVVEDGSVQAKPYLDIAGRVNSAGGEQGLLGLAFSPRFAEDRRLFVAYTDDSGALRIARFKADSPGADTARKSTEATLLRVKHPGASNHNGGMLAFGPDDRLYISTGDGGGGGDQFDNARKKSSRLGKILRINPLRSCGDKRYCVPDNPFAGPRAGSGLVLHLGLRNTWRFSFDRERGDLWLADVGQDRFEEVTRIPVGAKGRDLGWPCREGRTRFDSDRCDSSRTYHDPTVVYGRSGGGSVTGGYVYRGTDYADLLRGLYVFGDFESGQLWVYGQGHKTKVGNITNYTLTSFGESNDGELWAVTYDGVLHRVVATAR